MKLLIPLSRNLFVGSQSVVKQDNWLTIPICRLYTEQDDSQKKEIESLKMKIEALQKEIEALAAKLTGCEKKKSACEKKLHKKS